MMAFLGSHDFWFLVGTSLAKTVFLIFLVVLPMVSYTVYAERTPRFWPNPMLYRDQDQLVFSTSALKSTFRDGLYFLAVFPLIETVEHFRAIGVLPTLFSIY